MNTGISCAINLCATGGADRSYEDLFAKEVKLRGLAGSFKDSEGEDDDQAMSIMDAMPDIF